MKKYLIFLIVFVCIADTSLSIEKDTEKEAIIAVNEAEKKAYFNGDIKKLASIWIQEKSSQRIFTSEKGITTLVGWDEILPNYKEGAGSDSFKDIEVKFSNYEINLYSNTALVYHDVNWSGEYNGEELNVNQKRVAHLVKVDGKWKFDFLAMLKVIPE